MISMISEKDCFFSDDLTKLCSTTVALTILPAFYFEMGWSLEHHPLHSVHSKCILNNSSTSTETLVEYFLGKIQVLSWKRSLEVSL